MGLFKDQFLNVIEWDEARDDVIFWKWANKEIKKGSRLIIKPGQDAIFLYNGKVEGIFREEGNYEIETQIIPFLSTLMGFKFGFNSGLRAEVLFVNTKEFTENWGTPSAINIPSQGFPGGMPIRAFGTFNFKVSDYLVLIDKIAGVKNTFAVEDVKQRVLSLLNQFLMKWIVKEGKDMFNLQMNSFEIATGIKKELDEELSKIGFMVTGFNISNFNYPEEVQDRINKVASVGMVGNIDAYQKVSMIDAMNKDGGGNAMGSSMQSAMGLAAGLNMANNMFQDKEQNSDSNVKLNNIVNCKSCNKQISANAKFCPECGAKNDLKSEKFCSECGQKIEHNAKFCPECGAKNI